MAKPKLNPPRDRSVFYPPGPRLAERLAMAEIRKNPPHCQFCDNALNGTDECRTPGCPANNEQDSR